MHATAPQNPGQLWAKAGTHGSAAPNFSNNAAPYQWSRAGAAERWTPAFEGVKKCQTSSFRGAGIPREPGTDEHRTSNILEMGSGLSPEPVLGPRAARTRGGRPGMTFLGKNNFFTRSFAGEDEWIGCRRILAQPLRFTRPTVCPRTRIGTGSRMGHDMVMYGSLCQSGERGYSADC